MAISKRIRFEIFKRDNFQCQYCGKRVPEVILEIDHIIPKSKGGKDDSINLVTSCFSCNRGKSNILLSDNVTKNISKQDISNLKSQIKEQELQAKEYYKYLKKLNFLNGEGNPEIKIILEEFENIDMNVTNHGVKSIKKFLEKTTAAVILEAIDVLSYKDFDDKERAFRYFCGIVHNKINKKWESDE